MFLSLIQKLQTIDNHWFFGRPHPLFRLLLIFVKGDILILLPLTIFIFLSGIFISLKFALILLALYVIARNLGEMFYWIFQQFGVRQYRPDDYGFKRLDNHAVYIVYQTWSLAGIILGIAVLLYVLNIK